MFQCIYNAHWSCCLSEYPLTFFFFLITAFSVDPRPSPSHVSVKIMICFRWNHGRIVTDMYVSRMGPLCANLREGGTLRWNEFSVCSLMVSMLNSLLTNWVENLPFRSPILTSCASINATLQYIYIFLYSNPISFPHIQIFYKRFLLPTLSSVSISLATSQVFSAILISKFIRHGLSLVSQKQSSAFFLCDIS